MLIACAAKCSSLTKLYLEAGCHPRKDTNLCHKLYFVYRFYPKNYKGTASSAFTSASYLTPTQLVWAREKAEKQEFLSVLNWKQTNIKASIVPSEPELEEGGNQRNKR
jgi:hypothetical protein